MIGDYLYTLTARDTRVTPLDLVVSSRAGSGLVTSFNLRFQVPQEAIFALKHLWITMEAGGTQQPVRAQVTVLTPELLGICELFHKATPVSQINFQDGVQWNDLLIPPQHVILGLFTFDGAVSSNNVTMSVGGILLPRGNSSLGQLLP